MATIRNGIRLLLVDSKVSIVKPVCNEDNRFYNHIQNIMVMKYKGQFANIDFVRQFLFLPEILNEYYNICFQVNKKASDKIKQLKKWQLFFIMKHMKTRERLHRSQLMKNMIRSRDLAASQIYNQACLKTIMPPKSVKMISSSNFRKKLNLIEHKFYMAKSLPFLTKFVRLKKFHNSINMKTVIPLYTSDRKHHNKMIEYLSISRYEKGNTCRNRVADDTPINDNTEYSTKPIKQNDKSLSLVDVESVKSVKVNSSAVSKPKIDDKITNIQSDTINKTTNNGNISYNDCTSIYANDLHDTDKENEDVKPNFSKRKHSLDAGALNRFTKLKEKSPNDMYVDYIKWFVANNGFEFKKYIACSEQVNSDKAISNSTLSSSTIGKPEADVKVEVQKFNDPYDLMEMYSTQKTGVESDQSVMSKEDNIHGEQIIISEPTEVNRYTLNSLQDPMSINQLSLHNSFCKGMMPTPEPRCRFEKMPDNLSKLKKMNMSRQDKIMSLKHFRDKSGFENKLPIHKDAVNILETDKILENSVKTEEALEEKNLSTGTKVMVSATQDKQSVSNALQTPGLEAKVPSMEVLKKDDSATPDLYSIDLIKLIDKTLKMKDASVKQYNLLDNKKKTLPKINKYLNKRMDEYNNYKPKNTVFKKCIESLKANRKLEPKKKLEEFLIKLDVVAEKFNKGIRPLSKCNELLQHASNLSNLNFMTVPNSQRNHNDKPNPERNSLLVSEKTFKWGPTQAKLMPFISRSTDINKVPLFYHFYNSEKHQSTSASEMCSDAEQRSLEKNDEKVGFVYKDHACKPIRVIRIKGKTQSYQAKCRRQLEKKFQVTDKNSPEYGMLKTKRVPSYIYTNGYKNPPVLYTGFNRLARLKTVPIHYKANNQFVASDVKPYLTNVKVERAHLEPKETAISRIKKLTNQRGKLMGMISSGKEKEHCGLVATKLKQNKQFCNRIKMLKPHKVKKSVTKNNKKQLKTILYKTVQEKGRYKEQIDEIKRRVIDKTKAR